jgi:hypothetical protein
LISPQSLSLTPPNALIQTSLKKAHLPLKLFFTMARRIPRDWDDVDEEDINIDIRRGYRPAPPPREYLEVGAPLRRSRSSGGGARQAPNVVVVDNHLDRSPSRDRGRRRRYDSDEDLVDAVEDVAREIRRNRSRTPAPAPVQVIERDPGYGRDTGYGRKDMELELMRQRQHDVWEMERERDKLERELERDRLENREKLDYERQLATTRSKIRRLQDQLEEGEKDGKTKLERDRIIAEMERKERDKKEQEHIMKLELERKEHEKEEKERRMLAELRDKDARKKRERDEEERAAVEAYERKKNEEKKKREEIVAQIKLEEEEKKRKEKEEKERWIAKIEKEKREEEEKKKKKEEEIEEEMRKRLHRFGFQDNQVDVLIDPKKAPQLQQQQSTTLITAGGGPTYIKIHKDHVDIETLKYFKLPWGYDPSNSNYYLIFQEMDSKETEYLFEHTRKIRKRTTELLIEDRGRKHHHGQQLAFVRRRTPSASPSRGKRKESPKRVRIAFSQLFSHYTNRPLQILKLWP